MSAPGNDNDTEPRLSGMLLRDGAAVLALLSLWAAADTWTAATDLLLAQAVAIADGVLVGALLAAVLHEWGHYAGARAAGAVAPRVSPRGLSLFRYRFDFAANDQRQFHWMTGGGHVGHWSALLLLLSLVPMDTPGRVALAAGAFGFISFATFIEANVVMDTRQGADPLQRLQALSRKDFQQATRAGVVAGLIVLAVFS